MGRVGWCIVTGKDYQAHGDVCARFLNGKVGKEDVLAVGTNQGPLFIMTGLQTCGTGKVRIASNMLRRW